MCEFDPRCQGSDNVVQDALARITAGGWAVTGVYGDETGPPLTYSTGLVEFDRPELLIYGLDPELAIPLLNRAAELAIADAGLLGHPYLDGVLRPPYRMATLPAVHTDDLAVTRVLYGPDFRAVQLIWPDAQGRYPWDRGYAISPDAQPLAGVPHPLAG